MSIKDYHIRGQNSTIPPGGAGVLVMASAMAVKRRQAMLAEK